MKLAYVFWELDWYDTWVLYYLPDRSLALDTIMRDTF